MSMLPKAFEHVSVIPAKHQLVTATHTYRCDYSTSACCLSLPALLCEATAASASIEASIADLDDAIVAPPPGYILYMAHRLPTLCQSVPALLCVLLT